MGGWGAWKREVCEAGACDMQMRSERSHREVPKSAVVHVRRTECLDNVIQQRNIELLVTRKEGLHLIVKPARLPHLNKQRIHDLAS